MKIELTNTFWKESTTTRIFTALANEVSLFWLDSGNASMGWSFLGVRPNRRVAASALLSQPLRSPINYTNTYPKYNFQPPFQGGWIVNIRYPDKPLPFNLSSASISPQIEAHYYEAVLAYSHEDNVWFCLGKNLPGSSARSLRNKVKNLIHLCENPQQRSDKIHDECVQSGPETLQNRSNYIEQVQTALKYIRSGEIYQVNIAQGFSSSWKKHPSELYLRLRSTSPSFYGAYIGSGLTGDGRSICCISPELFLRVRGRHVLTRPIKGTRALGATPSQTLHIRREFEASPKERAELNMIVDLMRNDLGRVCSYGSVHVDSPGEIEELPTLLHRTATISGLLRPGATVRDVLAATFPGGSITGAPKLRAMQIIAELESFARGAYCGAIGWVGTNGNLELNIAIRTAICDEVKGEARYFAGAGIVADSDPEKEYDETLLKAAPFFKAVSGKY